MTRFPTSASESHVRPRVLIADDNRPVALQLTTLLSTSFEVVGVVRDAETLIERALSLRPDVIVTDISMPEQGGLTAVRTILAQRPDVAVVFATIHDGALVIQCAVATGALGYVVKSDCGEELELAVRAAVAGHEYLSTSARAALAAQRATE